MNNNLPEDLNTFPNQNKVDDVTIQSDENSNMLATPAQTFAEVVDTKDEEYTKPNEEDVHFALSSLENIIRQRLSIIEKTYQEVAELRTQLSDILANSEEYYKADKTVKEATKAKKQIKATIMGTQEAKTIQGKHDESKQFLKDNEMALSDLLLEYYETMRVKEIDDSEGEQRDLIVRVKVGPKKNK